MEAREKGRRNLGGSILAVVALLLACALPARGLDFASELLVYREDYVGELAYPTTPEVDEIGAGGLQGDTLPGPGPGPALTGVAAHASVSLLSEEMTSFQANSFGAGPIGIRGHFSNLSLASDSGGAALLKGLFDAPIEQVEVYAYAGGNRDPSGTLTSGFFGILELPAGTGPLISLSPAETAALAGGSPFSLDLLVDRDLATASAFLDIQGFATHSLGPVAIDSSAAGGALNGIAQFLGSNDVAGLLEVDFEGLEVYRIFSTSFAVDTLLDEVDDSVGDGACLSAAGLCSLRAAIQESNALAGPGEIILPSGTHLLGIAGVDEDDTATGDLDILDDLVIRGAGRDSTRVDAADLDRVFDLPFAAVNARVHLMDLEIANGSALASSGLGGGILNEGWLSLERCLITNNQASIAGGIMNRGQLRLDECIVTGNQADRTAGIASGSTSAGSSDAVATIRNSAIINNIGTNTVGVEFGNALSARVENTTVSGNSGVQLRFFNTDVVLQHVTIVTDSETALSGGSFLGTNTVEISNSAIEGTPACSLSTSAPAVVIRSGHNASNDTSCGFGATGDVEGIPLDLGPLAVVEDSQAHLPQVGSPLIDAADPDFCLPDDQVGMPRPIDGDASGSAECDLGAIEAPEPAVGIQLLCGVIWLHSLALRRRAGGS